MATQVASLFGTIDLQDNMTPALNTALGAFKGFGSAVSGVGDTLKEFGKQATIGLSLPIIGFFGAAVNAASNTQNALTQLDAVLKSTGDTADTASVVAGHWVTATEAAGPKAAKWKDELELLNAKLYDNESRLSKAKGPHAALQVTIDQEKDKIALLTSELGLNNVGTRTWVESQTKMSDVSHMSRDELVHMAYALEDTTRFSHDTTIGVESMMLTFTKVGKEIFPDATKAVLDLSTAMKEDTKSATIQLGKALDDPIKGITALTRVGVTFSTSQKDMIRSLQQSGDLMGAQKIILQELQKEFGGSAEAAGTTFAGQLDIAKNKLNDVMVIIGNALLPILSGLLSDFTSMIGGIQDINPGLVQLAFGVGVVIAAVGPLSFLLGTLLSPIGLIGVGVVGLAAAFATNFGGVRTTVEGAYNFIKPQLENLRSSIQGFWDDLQAPKHMQISAGEAEDMSKPQLQGVDQQNAKADTSFLKRLSDAISDYAPKLISDMQILFSKAVDGVTAWFASTGIPAIGGAIQAIGTWITTSGPGYVTAALTGIFDVGKTLLTNLLTGVTKMLNSAGDWITQNGPKAISDAIIGLFTPGDGTSFLTQVGTIIGKAVDWLGSDGLKLIGGAIGALFTLGDDALMAIGKGLGTAFGKLFSPGGAGVDALASLVLWWDGFFKDGGTLSQSFAKIGPWIASGLTSAFKAVRSIIVTPFAEAVKFIGNLLIGIGGAGGMFTDLGVQGAKLVQQATDLEAKASGGPVSGNTPYLVGENGPEVFMPTSSGSIIPNNMLGGGAGGGTAYITVNMSGVQDPERFMNEIDGVLRRRNMTLGSHLG